MQASPFHSCIFSSWSLLFGMCDLCAVALGKLTKGGLCVISVTSVLQWWHLQRKWNISVNSLLHNLCTSPICEFSTSCSPLPQEYQFYFLEKGCKHTLILRMWEHKQWALMISFFAFMQFVIQELIVSNVSNIRIFKCTPPLWKTDFVLLFYR